MAVDVRLDLRHEAITLDRGEVIYRIRWYLQATNPVRDLWQSCSLFETELKALYDFQEKSKLAGYSNLTFSFTDPTESDSL